MLTDNKKKIQERQYLHNILLMVDLSNSGPMKEWDVHMNEEVFALDRLLLYSKKRLSYSLLTENRVCLFTHIIAKTKTNILIL